MSYSRRWRAIARARMRIERVRPPYDGWGRMNWHRVGEIFYALDRAKTEYESFMKENGLWEQR